MPCCNKAIGAACTKLALENDIRRCPNCMKVMTRWPQKKDEITPCLIIAFIILAIILIMGIGRSRESENGSAQLGENGSAQLQSCVSVGNNKYTAALIKEPNAFVACMSPPNGVENTPLLYEMLAPGTGVAFIPGTGWPKECFKHWAIFPGQQRAKV